MHFEFYLLMKDIHESRLRQFSSQERCGTSDIRLRGNVLRLGAEV